MLKLSQFLFLLPTLFFVPIVCSFIKWNKERIKIALVCGPALYFLYKVLNFQYFEPLHFFIFDLIGLIISLL
ncbi:hypothetical protein, partial [Candidatus Enterococcus wittei]|uniref:hypothetical protein n=1 Tax=Candidatus Enterococcus wittei TaxID=1987383 RepID=UPI000A34A3A8